MAFFELGNLATTLLILRATDLLHTDARSLTAATSLAILLYAAHNAVAALAALAGGHLADRAGPRLVFAAGAGGYVLAYATFAVDQHAWPVLLAGFALAGIGIGFAETAESTVIALTLPDRLRGNGLRRPRPGSVPRRPRRLPGGRTLVGHHLRQPRVRLRRDLDGRIPAGLGPAARPPARSFNVRPARADHPVVTMTHRQRRPPRDQQEQPLRPWRSPACELWRSSTPAPARPWPSA